MPILDYCIERNSQPHAIQAFITQKKELFEEYPDSYHSLKLSSVNFCEESTRELLQSACDNNVKVLVDSENVEVQDVIDHVTYKLIVKHKFDAELFKTYQMYRTDMLDILWDDLCDFKQLDIKHNIKLVRGAYLFKDKKHGLLHDSKRQTDRAYDEAVKILLQTAQNNKHINVIFATHNEDSFQIFKDCTLPNVYHASLMGFESKFVNSGYVKKMVHLPFGPLYKCGPYLLRRLLENNKFLDDIMSTYPVNKNNYLRKTNLKTNQSLLFID